MTLHPAAKTDIKVDRQAVAQYAELHRDALKKLTVGNELTDAEKKATGSFNQYLSEHYGKPVRADLSGEDLSLTNLRLADLSDTVMHQVKFPAQVATRPEKHFLEGTSFRGADLTAADFRGAIIAGLNFADTVLVAGKLDGADATQTDFSGAQLTHAQAKRATLRQAILNDTDLEGFTATLAIVDEVDRKAEPLRFHFDDVLDEARRRCAEDGEKVQWISERDEEIAAFSRRGGGVQQRLGWEDRIQLQQQTDTPGKTR